MQLRTVYVLRPTMLINSSTLLVYLSIKCTAPTHKLVRSSTFTRELIFRLIHSFQPTENLSCVLFLATLPQPRTDKSDVTLETML